MTDRFTTKKLADYFIEQRCHANTFLDRIDALIDWKRIEKVLGRHYRKTASADGRPAYPALPMFKLLLLQRWYGLSDPGLEEAVNDRICFIRFSGVGDSFLACISHNFNARKLATGTNVTRRTFPIV